MFHPIKHSAIFYRHSKRGLQIFGYPALCYLTLKSKLEFLNIKFKISLSAAHDFSQKVLPRIIGTHFKKILVMYQNMPINFATFFARLSFCLCACLCACLLSYHIQKFQEHQICYFENLFPTLPETSITFRNPKT
jgi:hypothetical protein